MVLWGRQKKILTLLFYQSTWRLTRERVLAKITQLLHRRPGWTLWSVQSSFLLTQDVPHSLANTPACVCPSALALSQNRGEHGLPWADTLGQRPAADLEGAPRMDENKGKSRVRTGSTTENDAVGGQGRLVDTRGSKDLIRSHNWWEKRGKIQANTTPKAGSLVGVEAAGGC